MLLQLVLLTLTSSPSPREVYLPEDYEELKEAREKRDAVRAERDRKSSERKARWDSDRALRTMVRAGARVEAKLDGGSGEIAFGFSRRLAAALALQGDVSLGLGFGTRNDRSRGFLFDSGGDITLRIGARRFYFGLGPIARLWRIFGEETSFRVGGGAVIEFGVLFGDDREFDVVIRVQAGGFRRAGELDYWASETFALGWHI